MEIPTQEEIRQSLIVHVENIHGRGFRALSDTPITRGEVINLLAATAHLTMTAVAAAVRVLSPHAATPSE